MPPSKQSPVTTNERIKFLTRFSFRGPIAFFIVLAGFGFLFALLRFPIPPDNENIINVACGFILAIMKDVSGWLFGSSKAEADKTKTETVKDIITTNPAQPPAE